MQSANYDSPLTVQGNSSGEALPVSVTGAAADGAAVSGNPVLVAGSDGTNAQTVAVSSTGHVGLNTGTASLNDGISNASATYETTAANVIRARVRPEVYNGTTWDRLRGDTNGLITRGQGNSASATFTPAAASHTAGDVVGGAQAFDLNAPASCVFEIMSASLLINNATIETTAWTLHLYSVTPPSALADDAVFDIPSGDQASYLGFITLAQVVDYGSTLYIESNGIGKRVQLAASGDLFGYLVNGTTLTPGAVAHTVKLIGRPV